MQAQQLQQIASRAPSPPHSPRAASLTAPNRSFMPDNWEALVCCDLDHGSSSSSSSASRAHTHTHSHAGGETKCSSPCPFETYCCLDEHCEESHPHPHPHAADKCVAEPCTEACSSEACEDACFDPNCLPEDDALAAAGACCDQPGEDPSNWCGTGCTIEEYVSSGVRSGDRGD